MPLTSNKLTKQVDLPVFEWARPMPVAPTTGLSASCIADNQDFNQTSGRFIYAMLNATNFWRYDTIADAWQQLASPGITVATATSMRFAGAAGFYGRVISATSNTIQTGLPFGSLAVGYRIRIISGAGMGQTRIITSVADPVVADFGSATTGTNAVITDVNKTWGLSGGAIATNLNGWVGYVVRLVNSTGVGQMRKILYSSVNSITVADANIYAYDSLSMPLAAGAATAGFTTSPAAGSTYSIESSVITVDTAWDTAPDQTSRFVIQSGGVFLMSSAAAPQGINLQFYSILEDLWYAKGVNTTQIPLTPTDANLERLTENSSIWYSGTSTSAGSTTTLNDSTSTWSVNQWAGYVGIIWSGTGRGQLMNISANTSTQLTFTLVGGTTAPDSTSRYDIIGYDGGMASSASGRILFDTTKSWSIDRWRNYGIRIIGGTGVGQIRQILSNGSNSIVTYEPWNVQPDSTSIYLIISYPSDMYISLGANSETFLYRTNDVDLITHGRVLDEVVACVACAIPCDLGTTATHQILEQKPVAITALSGTSTITATTFQPHPFKVGDRVSIRGVAGGATAADAYNVTGKVTIATVPSATTFTYTPFAAGSGTYTFSNGVGITGSAIADASKYHADLATGGSTTTVTFTRAQPSNINGWYAYGTNIAAGAQVASGAGTTTLTFNLTGAGTPTGTIIFTKWPATVSLATGGGGGAGVFSATTATTIPAYAKGWLVTGTNIGLGSILTGGEGGTTLFMSNPCIGAVSGSILLSNPANNLPSVANIIASGGGTSSIFTTSSTPTYITGWYISGTGIANGTVVTGGAGTTSISLSLSCAASTTGTMTFYPPSTGVSMLYGNVTAPALAAAGLTYTTSSTVLVAQTVTANGTILVPLSVISQPLTGVSKFVISRRDMVGQAFPGQNLYLSGISTAAGTAATLIDGNAFWASASGTGTSGTSTLILTATGSSTHNGWFVTGTGIPVGTRVASGGGTSTITIDTTLTSAASGTMTFCAWAPSGAAASSLVGRRLRVISGTGVNQDLAIVSVTSATGSINFASGTAPASGSAYTVLPGAIPGAGSTIQWIFDSSSSAKKGRDIIRFNGGNTSQVCRISINTDLFTLFYTAPQTELLGSGTMYAYDQYDRIYINPSPSGTTSTRLMYLDLNNLMIYGAGQYPYAVGTASLGNIMEVFKTSDNLKYLWVNRKSNVECFRQLIFY